MTPSESTNGIPLAGSATFEPSGEILSQRLEGETVLLDLTSEKYFSIDATGTRIWQLVSEGVSLDSIVETLRCEFDVEPATLNDDVREFLQELLRAGLIQIRSVDPGR